MKLIGLKTCSTCKGIEKALKQKGIQYDYLDVRQNPPSYEDLLQIVGIIGEDKIKKLVNVTGNVYRERNLKETWGQMTLTEQMHALAEEGMLIKRPILWVSNQEVYIGKEVSAYLVEI